MTDSRPNTIPLAVLTDASTGLRVIVSGMWFRTLAESKQGTVITFTSGDTVTVEEDVMTVAHTFTSTS